MPMPLEESDDDAPGTGTAPRRGAGGLRRTPCIGVCSTTYGDLVCRGCKRFAHEIVAWNGFAQTQRDVVWARLRRLLAESVGAHVCITDATLLRAAARRAGVAEDAQPEAFAFQTMRLHPAPLADLGLAPIQDPSLDTAQAIAAIDREFYLRSQAHYEASFKTRV